jgi:hypothetical protein
MFEGDTARNAAATPSSVANWSASGTIGRMSAQRTVWQARWWRAALASGLLTLALRAFGMTQTFAVPDVGDICMFGQGQDFDLEYWAAHRQDSPLPPYSSPCNAEYDRVPAWVNPTIAVTAVLCALSLAGLVVVRSARRGRTEGEVSAEGL